MRERERERERERDRQTDRQRQREKQTILHITLFCFTIFFLQTGEVLQSVEFPATRTTSCCFGGKNLDELYVTTSVYEAPEEEMKEYPLGGSLFRVKGLGVKGYSANMYEGNIPA